MNKQNFDKLMQEKTDLFPPKTKLLLHACCAPCSTYCLTRLIERFDVTLFYSNDNIMPQDEWNKRYGELLKLVGIVNGGKFELNPVCPVKLIAKTYDNGVFLTVAKGMEDQREGQNRCFNCYNMRLESTAKYAKENGYELFATTLSVSPYKNSAWLNAIGQELAEKYNVEFLPSDFKKNDGYNQSIRLSNKYGLYRQHYCGCQLGENKTE